MFRAMENEEISALSGALPSRAIFNCAHAQDTTNSIRHGVFGTPLTSAGFQLTR
jgi:hypothetical protein